jgi:hypothetical protein
VKGGGQRLVTRVTQSGRLGPYMGAARVLRLISVHLIQVATHPIYSIIIN